MFSTLPNHHSLVEAAKITYSRNGYAVVSSESGVLESGIDFMAQSTTGEKVGVKCIYAGDTLISGEQLMAIRDQAPKKVAIHVLTPAKFSLGAIDYAKKKKIELIDGSRIKWSMGTYILEADRVPNCTGGLPVAEKVKAAGKGTLFTGLRLALVAAIGFGIYAYDKLEIIDGSLSWGGPKNITKGVSDFHFVEDCEGIDPKVRARRDAMSLVSHLRRQKHAGTDYMTIAGGDVATALRLMVERFRVTTADDQPQYQVNFETICSPGSNRITEAAEFLSIDLDGRVAYDNDMSRLEDMIPVSLKVE